VEGWRGEKAQGSKLKGKRGNKAGTECQVSGVRVQGKRKQRRRASKKCQEGGR
jgi:hypothetical protein